MTQLGCHFIFRKLSMFDHTFIGMGQEGAFHFQGPSAMVGTIARSSIWTKTSSGSP